MHFIQKVSWTFLSIATLLTCVVIYFQHREREQACYSFLQKQAKLIYENLNANDIFTREDTAHWHAMVSHQLYNERIVKDHATQYEVLLFDSENNLVSTSIKDRTYFGEIVRAVLAISHNTSAIVGHASFRSAYFKTTQYAMCAFTKTTTGTIILVAPYDFTISSLIHTHSVFYLVWTLCWLVIALFLYYFFRSLQNSKQRFRQFIKDANKGRPTTVIQKKTLYHDDLELIYERIVTLYTELKEKYITNEQEKEAALQEVKEKVQMKRELTNNINHELKTPVASIRGYIETLLQNPDIDASTRITFLEKSLLQTERLSALLRDVMTISTLEEANQQTQACEWIDVAKIVHTIAADLSLASSKRPIRLISNFDTGTYIYGEITLIQSVFQNLANNAVAYSGGSNIFVHIIAEDQDFYTFTFADNGIGVEEKHLPHLFERFYRADKGRSRKLGGTGLGLAIVKNAVLHHGGTISVNIGEYGGLQFTFTLPKHP